ncbi:MAG: type II CAAX prenyl endopeptidase Rce1 family protein [Candidatus Hodarchaeota archaeon]
MKEQKLKLFSLAKIITREILIQEEIQYSDLYRSKFFENIKKSQRFIRNKILATKIFGAIIFGVLPIIPLVTYLQIIHYLDNNIIPIDIVIFGGGIIFSIFFLVQFFNFFLLAMINTTMIMSGKIFEWYESLPITRDTLKRLVFLTIFRSLDLPILVIIFAFPITMFIGTLDILILVICGSISLLNFLFSFLILVVFGERINRIMDINEANSKKTFFIRIFNLFSYVLIVVSSVYLIQWASESIGTFFSLFANQENTAFINLILSIIPYPLNPGYFIALFITPNQVSLNLWISISIGLIIFITLTWGIYKQSLKSLDHATISKFKPIKRKVLLDKDNFSVKIKRKKPVGAFLKKDLIIASRDLKSFMSIVMPIFLSFIFVFTYDISNKELILNWFVLVGFNIIITGITVNGILKIEEPSETIKASLPIVQRHQAKAKLILIFGVYIVALISPLILYINNTDFNEFLIITLLTFPIAVIFLLIMFIMRIRFFSKLRNFYIVEEINPQNKFIKWAIIFASVLLIYIVIFQIMFQIYITEGLPNSIFLLMIFVIISFIITILTFNNLFPIIRLNKKPMKVEILKESKVRTQSRGFAYHPWISTICLIILYFIFLYITGFIPLPSSPLITQPITITPVSYIIQLFFYVIIKNVIHALLWVVIVPTLMKLPYGKTTTSRYFTDIGLGFMKQISKRFVLGIMAGILIVSGFCYSYLMLIPEADLLTIFEPSIIIFSLYFGFILWHEILFRGVLLKIFLRRYKFRIALFLNALLYSLIVNVPFLFEIFDNFLQVFLSIIISFITGLLFAYICAKANSLIPSIIANLILMYFNFPIYWIFMIFEPSIYLI